MCSYESRKEETMENDNFSGELQEQENAMEPQQSKSGIEPLNEQKLETDGIEAEQTVVEAAQPEAEDVAQSKIAEAQEFSSAVKSASPQKHNVLNIVLAALLGAVLMAVVALAVLFGTGVLPAGSTNDPETTVPETTQQLNLKSYTVDDETAEKIQNDVVVKVGNVEMDNGMLQVNYRMSIYDFISANYYYLSHMGVDFNSPLDQQAFGSDGTTSWQQTMLEYSLQLWHQYAAINQLAESEGFQLDEEGQTYMSELSSSLQDSLAQSEYESIEQMLAAEMGIGATEEDYINYLKMSYIAYRYMQHRQEYIQPTQEELEKYFADNEESFTSSGVTKDSGDVVDVRHILITPEGGTTDENNNTVYSDEEWDACLKKAQEIWDQWKSGEADEDSFSELAKLHSKDSNASTGGLYEGVTEGYMVETFNDWIFDEARVYGETGLIKTRFGYHIIFFKNREAQWIAQARTGFVNDAISAILTAATEQYPMEVSYESIGLSKASLG